MDKLPFDMSDFDSFCNLHFRDLEIKDYYKMRDKTLRDMMHIHRDKFHNEAVKNYNTRVKENDNRPLVGENIYIDNKRYSLIHDWGDGFQYGLGSLCLSIRGGFNYSGSCNRSLDINKIKKLDTYDLACNSWSFYCGDVKAHNSINVNILVRNWIYES